MLTVFRTKMLMVGLSRSFSSVPNARVGTERNGKDIVLVDGVRTPFLLSGTDYNSLMSYELMWMALTGLANKMSLDKSLVDYICVGTVSQV